MKSFKIIIISILFFSIQSLQAVNNTTTVPVVTSSEFEPETDDKVNPELLNTLPAVNILNLSGVDYNRIVIQRFVVHTLPNANAGTLYLADEQTEVTVGQYLNLEETNGLRFDPNENFEGNATFTYSSVDINDVVDSTPATVTLPIVGAVVNGDTSDECNTTVNPVVHNANCTCKDYETSIPALSSFGFFLMFVLSILIVGIFARKETSL
jgi:hypothetical protein